MAHYFNSSSSLALGAMVRASLKGIISRALNPSPSSQAISSALSSAACHSSLSSLTAAAVGKAPIASPCNGAIVFAPIRSHLSSLLQSASKSSLPSPPHASLIASASSRSASNELLPAVTRHAALPSGTHMLTSPASGVEFLSVSKSLLLMSCNKAANGSMRAAVSSISGSGRSRSMLLMSSLASRSYSSLSASSRCQPLRLQRAATCSAGCRTLLGVARWQSGRGSRRCLSSLIPKKLPPLQLWESLRSSLGPILRQLAAGLNQLTAVLRRVAVLRQMMTAGRSLAAKYRVAAGLQLEAFWRRNFVFIAAAAAIFLISLLWRLLYSTASLFINLSEGLAKYGFLALSAAAVAFGGLYLSARYNVNPDAVYRLTMRQLNSNAGVLEVMGAPLVGSNARAYVMSGGGLRLKNLRLRLSSRRCFLIFPVQGAEKRGLASVEVKKKHGKYITKLLAIDIAGSSSQGDVRLYVAGNDAVYSNTGGVLMELRDPIIKALAKEKDFEAEDEKEVEEDELEAK